MSTKATIVIIEDEKNICSFISRILEPEGYRVITSNTGRDGLQHINSNHPDLILLDLGLPDMDGLDISRMCVSGVLPLLLSFLPVPWKTAK